VSVYIHEQFSVKYSFLKAAPHPMSTPNARMGLRAWDGACSMDW
jgi:hypothetical protein